MVNRHEEISRAAYGLYEKSGRVPGMDEANWFEAEKELLAAQKPVKRRRAAKKRPASGAPKKGRAKK